MTSPQKRKGDAAERLYVATLNERGYGAVRDPAGAKLDRGDIFVPYVEWPTVDVKAHDTPAFRQWLNRAHQQAANAGRVTGSVVWKPRGVADPDDWFHIFTVRGFLDLMEQFR